MEKHKAFPSEAFHFLNEALVFSHGRRGLLNRNCSHLFPHAKLKKTQNLFLVSSHVALHKIADLRGQLRNTPNL